MASEEQHCLGGCSSCALESAVRVQARAFKRSHAHTHWVGPAYTGKIEYCGQNCCGFGSGCARREEVHQGARTAGQKLI